jgi:transporter family protein
MSGIVAGLLGMWSYFSAMKYWEASRVVPIVGAYPLFAFLFSLHLLGEQLTLQKGIGVILIVGGVILLG